MSTYNLAMFSVAKTVPVGRMKHYGAPKADFIIQKPFLQFRNCLPLSETILCTRKTTFSIFSAPEPKAQVHYCDHALSVVRRPSVRRPSVRPSVRPSLTLHIFNFFSETAERNSTKLDRKQDLNVLYQVCVFRADRKNKMAALASHWLRHFRLLL